MGFWRYNALWATFKNNSWRGLTFLSSFTFAKNIVSAYASSSDQSNTSYWVPYIWAGPAQLSPRLRFVNSFSYDLPFGKAKRLTSGSAPVNALVGGWRVSGIIDTTTGVPQTVIFPDNSGTSYGTHPDRICDPRHVPGGRSRLQWFNTACFQQTTFGIWGNSPIGDYEDPGIANVNLAILRSFKLPLESSSLDFRADFFDALNHTQWGPSIPSFTNVNYGRITSTRAPRQSQLSR